MTLSLLAASSLACVDQSLGPVHHYVRFTGSASYVEAPTRAALSVSAAGLTVAAWLRPDSLTFPKTEGCGYIHWLGKGAGDQQEWAFRMYDSGDTCSPSRSRRISFYVFNLKSAAGTENLGCGAYFQDPIQAGEWVQVVGSVDTAAQTVAIYKNGVQRNTTSFAGKITPQPGSAPLRIGTRDKQTFLVGGVSDVMVWNRPLSAAKVQDLYRKGNPPTGLVARWPLDEGSGLTAHDSVGGDDGRLFAATWGSQSGVQTSSASAESGGGC